MAEQQTIPKVSDRKPINGSTSSRIIDAARTEFANLGFEGARVDQIASRAGVNKAMIYYHFKSKKELYLEVIRAFHLEARALMQQQTASATSIEELLTALAGVYAELFGRIDEIRPIIMRELANPNDEVTSHVAQILGGSGIPQQVMTFLQKGKENFEIREIDIRQALISFVTMNIGYFFLAPLIDRVLNITDRETFIQQRKQAVVDIFLDGIRVK